MKNTADMKQKYAGCVGLSLYFVSKNLLNVTSKNKFISDIVPLYSEDVLDTTNYQNVHILAGWRSLLENRLATGSILRKFDDLNKYNLSKSSKNKGKTLMSSSDGYMRHMNIVSKTYDFVGRTDIPLDSRILDFNTSNEMFKHTLYDFIKRELAKKRFILLLANFNSDLFLYTASKENSSVAKKRRKYFYNQGVLEGKRNQLCTSTDYLASFKYQTIVITRVDWDSVNIENSIVTYYNSVLADSMQYSTYKDLLKAVNENYMFLSLGKL